MTETVACLLGLLVIAFVAGFIAFRAFESGKSDGGTAANFILFGTLACVDLALFVLFAVKAVSDFWGSL